MPLIYFLWLCESLLDLFFFYEVVECFESLNIYDVWCSCNIHEMQKKYQMGIHCFCDLCLVTPFWFKFFCVKAFLQSSHCIWRTLDPSPCSVFLQFKCGKHGTGSMVEMVFRAPGWLTECEKVIQSCTNSLRHSSYGLGLGSRAASALTSVFWTRLESEAWCHYHSKCIVC